MWEWYRIGLAVGIGVGAGVLFAGLLASARAGVGAALGLAVAAGVGAGFLVENWQEAIGGGLGGLAGSAGAVQVVRGTLRRGGTRAGTSLLLGGAGVVLAALAFAPALGYLEAILVPVAGARLRRRAGGRYAGLRILARD